MVGKPEFHKLVRILRPLLLTSHSSNITLFLSYFETQLLKAFFQVSSGTICWIRWWYSVGVAVNRKGNACRQKGTSSLVSLIDGLRPKVHSLCHGAHQAIMLFPFMILYDLPHLGNGKFLDLSRVGFKSSCVLLRFASAVVSMYTVNWPSWKSFFSPSLLGLRQRRAKSYNAKVYYFYSFFFFFLGGGGGGREGGWDGHWLDLVTFRDILGRITWCTAQKQSFRVKHKLHMSIGCLLTP